jgi:type 1 glutamine amidotransferase
LNATVRLQDHRSAWRALRLALPLLIAVVALGGACSKPGSDAMPAGAGGTLFPGCGGNACVAGSGGAAGSGAGGASVGDAGVGGGAGAAAGAGGSGGAGGGAAAGAGGGGTTGAGGGATTGAGGGGATDAATTCACPFHVLLFSKTAAYRHDSIPAATAALMAMQTAGGYLADATEDATRFSATGLAGYDVVVFLLTTGDVLDDAEQTAFEAWVRAGGGYVGVHSASDTEYDWTFYGQLVGAYFSDHPAIQPATVHIEQPGHPIMTGLPNPWKRTDEWYNFRSNPRANVTVLATLDETTYSGGTMGSDHPITWAHEDLGGRAFYTAMGHAADAYSEPAFRQMLLAALRWAAHRL